MPFHVQVSSSMSRSATMFNLSLDELRERVLDPWEQGSEIVADGKVFSLRERVDVKIFEGEQLGREDIGPGGIGWLVVMQRDTPVTDAYIRSAPGSATGKTQARSETTAPDARRVGVVYGRDVEANRSLFAFLRALDLHPLEFDTLISHTGSGTPYIGTVVEELFGQAYCVVVLFTPDEAVSLREDLRSASGADSEAGALGQPRPNVLFEAGMAFALHPDRTILVEVGSIRPISDLAGRHVVRLDGSPAALGRLQRRLIDAGAAVDAGTDWLDPGNFPGLNPNQ